MTRILNVKLVDLRELAELIDRLRKYAALYKLNIDSHCCSTDYGKGSITIDIWGFDFNDLVTSTELNRVKNLVA